ncbi:MAG: SpoIIE family protein phosphatase [Catenulispora sp.]|nr:SpoIIE family protein phosphatase [Catenulispora sp.]
MLRASAPVLERLHGMLVDTKVSVVLCDGGARVLVRRAGESGLNRHLDAVQLAEGFSYHEADAGTNGIGTALVEGRLAVVLGDEHFADRFVGFACAGVPIRDPFSGRIRGVVDLTAWSRDATPLMAALAAQAAENIELRLLEQYSARERTLLAESRRGGLRGASVAGGGAAACGGTPVRTEQQAVGDVGGQRQGDGRLPVLVSARDGDLVRTKAAELVAAARRDVVTIPLSDGRRAKLTARTGRSAAGTEVVTVEAELSGPDATPHDEGRWGSEEWREVEESWESAEGALGEAAPGDDFTGRQLLDEPPAHVADVTAQALGAQARQAAGQTGAGAGPVGAGTQVMTLAPRPMSSLATVDEQVEVEGEVEAERQAGEERRATRAVSSATPTSATVPGQTRATVSRPTASTDAGRSEEEKSAGEGKSEEGNSVGQGKSVEAGQSVGEGKSTEAGKSLPNTGDAGGSYDGRISNNSSHDGNASDSNDNSRDPDDPPRTRPADLNRTTPYPLPPPAELVLVGEPTVGQIALEARQRLALLLYASGRIGTTLDMELTGGELAEIALPDFAQHVAVDLASWVLDGEEVPPPGAEVKLRRVAVRTIRMGKVHRPPGAHVAYNAATAQARCMVQRRPVLDAALTAATAGKRWVAEDPDSSVIAAPIIVQGTVLGVASFYRLGTADPFDEEDIQLAWDLASRAAVCLDNARRFERERAMALALQRSLLPRAFPMQCAVEVAHRYLPAQEGVGGDWYDVIPLSGGRVALVVGDVVGHGIHAAATMGRLRTAVRNFCALDLTPEDLLGQLDALVESMDADEAEDQRGVGIIGATCLYVVYDPVTGMCSVAAAGHPDPAVVARDGSVAFLDLPTGPPLGLGGSSYEAVELPIEEGSTLVLYTDGLVESRDQDIGTGLERLSAVLAGPGRDPEELCASAIGGLLPARPWDDVALLAARTRRTTPDRVATWDVPLSPESVSFLRAEVSRQLRAWRLNDLVFTTELVVSELVTNAIRHATGPVELRLLRDRALICEVADGSSVSPRLRRAQTLDEGGRGLFLVAQLSQRWGTRYTARGKVIWAEQPLPAYGVY